MTITTLAAEVAAAAAPHADRHDREGSFVAESIEKAREVGYLRAALPQDFDGAGGSTRDLVEGQRVIGRACGSTALALSMHTHVVLAAAWRWRRGDTAVERLLGRVRDGAVVASSGGADWTHPTTVATPVDGGWRVSGRKTFVSLSPVADLVVTFAVVDAPAPGNDVIVFGQPLHGDGVTIVETWDAMGMRGTGSHDVVLDDVFVADAQVTGHRTWGLLDRPLLLASAHAWPVIAASYLGVAEGLADTVLGTGSRASDRVAGRITHELRVGRWALQGALDDIGDDPEPDDTTFAAVQHAKLVVAEACGRVADLALEAAGGGAFAKPSAVARAVRDLQGLRYHPMAGDSILDLVGQQVLAAPERD